MWNGKMAARWRGKDGDLNAGNSGFLVSNTSSELVLSRLGVGGVEMDTQSCMDHSILAIFEDSAVSSEDKSGVEEESETLLSALTEMLDSVGDDDGTLSPFDTLPDSKLLTHPELRDNSVEFAGRLRPRSKSPNATFTIKADDEMEDDCKLERSSPPQLLKQQSLSRNKKAEAEVEVFTSVSLVNLVRLMHPYCLKLRVEEEGDELRKNHTFSQEEVWKYERPSEESDEEINVVSDDEVTVGGTKEEDERGVDNNRLKSVLLNRNSSGAPPSREKKRVSFGLVQVASFESAEKGLNGTHLTSGHTSETVSLPLNTTEALVNPAGPALEPQTSSSEMNSNTAEVLLLRGETKAKSLSLQQYRQLRQQRQPLVEKERNYITMWPCVSEPPKELTPILCLQGQNSGGPNAAHRYPDGRRSDAEQLHRSQTPGHKTHCISAAPKPQPSEAKPSTHPRCNGLKRPRTESKTFSPASLQPDITANPNVTVPESKKSPVKKPTLLSSDPPNPVLLPLTTQTTSPTTMELLKRDSNLNSIRHFPGNQNESSGSCLKRQPSSSGPKPEVSLGNPGYTTLLQEIKNKLSEIASGVSSTTPALFPTTTQIKSAPECRKPHRCHPNPTEEEAKHEPKTPLSANPDTAKQITCPSLSSPAPVDATMIPVDGTLSEVQLNVSPPEEPASTLQSGCRVQTADSGIEAPDLTSLLEQFEETQAKEESVCEKKPEPKLAASPSNLQTDGHLDRTQPVGTERASVEALEAFSTSELPGNPKTASSSQDLKTSEGADIPEPHGTEVVLSTQQDLPARRKNPPSKAIQIIEPRPLPSKKTHASLPEFPAAHTSAHMYSSVSSDHDYCGTINLTSASQHSRASKLKDVSQTFDELQGKTNDSSAAAECKKQTSTSVLNTAVRAVHTSPKSATQRLSEQPSTRSETGVFSDCAATEQRCGCAAEDKLAPCTLPTPPPSPPARGRDKRRYRRRSPCSDSSSSSPSSSSSSESPSPKRQKRRHKRSESSSSSSSSLSRSPPGRCRWSYSRSRCSRSRSRSWSQSRSPSPQVCRRQWRDVYSRRLPLIPTHHPDSSRESRKLRREHEIRIQKLKAIEERRVVYVGRIRRSMTHDELRERFSQFGDVECVSLHFRDRGDHYGFVTFYNKDDAFAAIDNGGKLRKPDELPFDICFGGRRQFCNSHYADLDANRDAEPAPAKSRFEDVDFDSLLKQAQRGVTM